MRRLNAKALPPRNSSGWHRVLLLIIALLHSAEAQRGSANDNLLEPSTDQRAAAELALNRGIVLFEKSDYPGALTEFRRAGGDNAIAAQYAQICQTEVDRASSGSNSENDGSLANSSAGYSDLPPLEGAANSGLACQGNQSAEQEKYWHLTLLTAFQVDSNVSLEPEFQGLGGNRGITDSSWLVATYGDYQILHEPDWNIGVIGSAFSNFYFSANEFDLQDFMGGTYTNRIVAPNVMASLRYEFHDILLGSDPFVEQHRLVPNLTLLSGDWGHTTMYYEFDNQTFETRPLVPAMDRDGQTHAVGATQAIYTMEGLGRWYFGYRFAHEITDGTDFDGDSHMVTARVEKPTGCKTIVDAEVRQFWDDYSNPNSLDFFGHARRDQRTEFRAGWQWYRTKHTSLRLDYTFIHSDSNTQNLFGVRFFDYDRHVLATQYIIDF